MLNYFKLLVILLVSVFMASCGSTGANGLGTTVKVYASNTSGQSISTALAVGTPGSFGTGSLSFTIKSDILPHPNGIVSSPVLITMARISYSPLPDNSGNPSPALPSFTKIMSVSVPAGGTGAVDNMLVTSPTVLQYLYDNFVAPPTGLLNTPGMEFRYGVVVEFSGYEVNSGAPIICDPIFGNMYVTK